jgi:hypothetical protein
LAYDVEILGYGIIVAFAACSLLDVPFLGLIVQEKNNQVLVTVWDAPAGTERRAVLAPSAI